MGRGTAFILGLLGLILPGFLFYLNWEFLVSTTIIVFQGFFYRFFYTSPAGGEAETELHWLDVDTWLEPEPWGGDIQLYLYLAGFALAVLGIVVLLGSVKGGSFLLLLGGLANLGLMALMYSDLEDVFQFVGISGYPIPVGAIFLILAAIVGLRE